MQVLRSELIGVLDSPDSLQGTTCHVKDPSPRNIRVSVTLITSGNMERLSRPWNGNLDWIPWHGCLKMDAVPH